MGSVIDIDTGRHEPTLQMKNWLCNRLQQAVCFWVLFLQV